MPTTNEISRWNDILGSELGRNRYGEPLYRWEYSEHVQRQKVVVETANRPAMRWTANDAGLLVPSPVTTREKAWPWLNQQWVVTHWNFTPLDEWTKAFDGLLEWPARGYYAPTNASLNHGDVPTTEITWAFVGMCKEERKHTFHDYMDQAERGLEREEKLKDAELEALIGEESLPFGNPWPGTCGIGLHLPTPAFQANPVIPESPAMRDK